MRILRHILARLSFLLCRYLNGWAPLPLVFFITINNRCNLKCTTCDVGQGQKTSRLYIDLKRENELSAENWKAFIDQIAAYRPYIDIGTTEPLLYRGLADVLNHIKARRLKCCVTTNGFVLSEFAKEIAETGIDRLIVSIDGPRKIHDRIRGVKGAFDRAIEGVQKLKGLNGSIKIGVNYTISDLNYFCLYDTIGMLKERMGWDSFLFVHLSFVTEEMARLHNARYKGHCATAVDISGVNLDNIDTDVLGREINAVKKTCRSKPVRFHPEVPLNKLHIYYRDPVSFVTPAACRIPWLFANITSDGNVIPLNRCQAGSVGSIENAPFRKIWNDKPMRDFRTALRRAGAFPICSRCGGLAVK
jgi:MoaA/NifB/PqqE/SkfB family radical SAM enzyme